METSKETKKEKATSVQIKNWMLSPFYAWLDIPLHSEQAVARNRIAKLLKEKAEDFETDRLEAIEKYKVYDPITKEAILSKGKDGKDVFKISDLPAWEKEYEVLRNQVVFFDLLPSTRPYWKIVRELIKNTKIDMDIETTNLWEELLEAMSVA